MRTDTTKTGTAVVSLAIDGKIIGWPIGCTNHDTEDTIREHVKKWHPEAEVLEVEFFFDTQQTPKDR